MANAELTAQTIDAAIQQLARTFLTNVQSAPRKNVQVHGWGQYIPPFGGNQVGLYGTCSGIICVALAHSGTQVPDSIVEYINDLWANRNTAGSDGARNFALTARCAFLNLALRLANDIRFQQTQQEIVSELTSRILPNGEFTPWRIDDKSRGNSGSVMASGLAILSFALAPGSSVGLPDDILNAATVLQKRLNQAPPLNEGMHKLLLASTALALRTKSATGVSKGTIDRSDILTLTDRQDTLDFWDYSWLAAGGIQQRRDYMHVPSAAVDILLASTSSLTNAKRTKAVQLTCNVVSEIQNKGAFFGGREIATSKSQAWIALSLTEAKRLLQTPEPSGIKRWWGRYTSLMTAHENL